ncbi:MAG: hypothetical protein ACREM2_10680 [Vulcanimicrobiaceae bacterium]
MATVITGLSSSGDIGALRSALTAKGFELDRLQVIAPDDSTENIARGLIGSEILMNDSGTSVPGLNRSGGRPAAFFRNETLSDRLGDLEIPDSEVENYVEALERGTSVVAFFARPENAERIEAIFHESGLANVRRF